jgi:hypothetical protein
MRIVSYNYLKEAYELLDADGTKLSNKRLRRMAYLDVHQNNYTAYRLYNTYKKIVNSEAANNQLMVLVIVLGYSTIISIFSESKSILLGMCILFPITPNLTITELSTFSSLEVLT